MAVFVHCDACETEEVMEFWEDMDGWDLPPEWMHYEYQRDGDATFSYVQFCSEKCKDVYLTNVIEAEPS